MRSIAVLTSVHPPFDGRIFHKECRSFVAAGYQVTLIVPTNEEVVSEVAGVRLVKLPLPAGRGERIFSTTLQVYRAALAEAADCYHFHDPELIPVGLMLRLRRKRVVYDVHENVPAQILSKRWIWAPLRTIVSGVVDVIERIGAKLLTGVVVAFPVIRERLGPACVVVQNYPRLEEFGSESMTPRQMTTPPAIGYVGVVDETRGPMELMAALASLQESCPCRLLLAGRFSSDRLERRVRATEGWKHVDYRGFLGRRELASMLSECSVGVINHHPVPNYRDGGSPNKLFEYMAAGLPVAASNIPAWESILMRHGCGLTFDPKDPGQIAVVLERLLNDPTQAESMGKRGRQAVETEYNWDAEARKLLGLYQQLMETTDIRQAATQTSGGGRK